MSLLVKFTGFTGKTLGIISCDAYDMTLSGINSVPFIFLMRNCIKSWSCSSYCIVLSGKYFKSFLYFQIYENVI